MPPAATAAVAASPLPHHTLAQTYGERAQADNLSPLAHYLLRLIHFKRTNLCVSADVTSTSELLRLAEDVGDHICVLKTHCDIVHDFGERTIRGLNEISRRKKFVVFEDRKFGDIGNTVQQQYTAGPLQIVRWALIINCHIFPGPSVISALREGAQKAIAAHNTSVSTDISASPIFSPVGFGNDDLSDEEGGDDDDDDDDDDSDPDEEEPAYDPRNVRKPSIVSVSTTVSQKTETLSPRPSLRPSMSRGSSEDMREEETHEELAQQLEELGPPPFYRSLLLLAQMSSAHNFFTPEYTAACVHEARAHRSFVMGFIAQQTLNSDLDDNFITMTPGVQLAAGGDGMGQQYNTPRRVVGESGTDIIIVGRGILHAPDRGRAALEYRKQGWIAYEERVRATRRRLSR